MSNLNSFRNPTPNINITDVLWEPYQDSHRLLNIDSEITMISAEMDEIEKLWDRVYGCETFHKCDFLDIKS